MALLPLINIIGNLGDIFGATDNGCSLKVQLCGFGSIAPRVLGTAMIVQTSPLPIDCPQGTFSVQLYGNDVINPLGTYYTFQLVDEEGNVLQTAAYQFFGAGGPRDLSDQTPMVVQAINAYVQLGYSLTPFLAEPIFAPVPAPVATYDITITDDVTRSSMAQLVQGQIVIFIIRQDSDGGHTFAFPQPVLNESIINPDPDGVSVQAFICDGTFLYPIGPITWQ